MDDENQNILLNIENSISTMIIYRSLYLLKQKLKINKEKLKEIYIKYNVNEDNINEEILDYLIKKDDFAKITEDIFRSINLLILKMINPKDIFLSPIFYENKIQEMINILQEIQNLINNNSLYIGKYNSIYYDKKIKPLILKYQQDNLDEIKLKEIMEKNIAKNNRYNLSINEIKDNAYETNEINIENENSQKDDQNNKAIIDNKSEEKEYNNKDIINYIDENNISINDKNSVEKNDNKEINNNNNDDIDKITKEDLSIQNKDNKDNKENDNENNIEKNEDNNVKINEEDNKEINNNDEFGNSNIKDRDNNEINNNNIENKKEDEIENSNTLFKEKKLFSKNENINAENNSTNNNIKENIILNDEEKDKNNNNIIEEEKNKESKNNEIIEEINNNNNTKENKSDEIKENNENNNEKINNELNNDKNIENNKDNKDNNNKELISNENENKKEKEEKDEEKQKLEESKTSKINDIIKDNINETKENKEVENNVDLNKENNDKNDINSNNSQKGTKTDIIKSINNSNENKEKEKDIENNFSLNADNQNHIDITKTDKIEKNEVEIKQEINEDKNIEEINEKKKEENEEEEIKEEKNKEIKEEGNDDEEKEEEKEEKNDGEKEEEKEEDIKIEEKEERENTNENINKSVSIKNEEEIDDKEEIDYEISRKIIEYNRKGKIISDYEELEENNLKIIIERKNKEKERLLKISIKEINDKNLLYIETLPLILADFLQENQNYAIIEIKSDLSKDLYALFDEQLLKFINEYDEIKISKSNNNKKVQNTELDNIINEYNNIKGNIKIFKNILKNKKSKNENVVHIKNMIERLTVKEVYLEHKIKIINQEKPLSLLEKIKDINKSQKIQSNLEFINFNKNELYTKNINITNSLNMSNNSQKITLANENENLINNINNNININNNYFEKKSILIKNFLNKKEKIKSINYSMAMKSLEILKNKRNSIQSIISDQNNIINNDIKQKINIALEEIFNFYSKKHNIIGHSLFSNIEEKKKHLDLYEFSMFCHEFNIPISGQKLVEIFKKNTKNINLMTIEEFKNIMGILSNEAFEYKKKSLKEKILIQKSKLKKIENNERQDIEEEKIQRIFGEEFHGRNKNIFNFKSNNNSIISINNSSLIQNDEEKRQKYYLEKKNKIKNEILQIKTEYNNTLKKSFKEYFVDFCEFLKLTSVDKKYRIKMKGYKIPPIVLNNIKENKIFNIDDLNKNNDTQNLNKNNDNQNFIFSNNKKKKNILLDKDKLYNISGQKYSSSTERKFKRKKMLNLNKKMNTNDDDLKNKIWWSKLKNYDINELKMSAKDKMFFSDLDNNYEINSYSDRRNKSRNKKDKINDLNTKGIKNNKMKKVKLINNKSDADIFSKKINFKIKKNLVLPPILKNSKILGDKSIKGNYKIIKNISSDNKDANKNSLIISLNKKNNNIFQTTNNYSSIFLRRNKILRNNSCTNITKK